MTTMTPRPICMVCRRPLNEGEQYLVRNTGDRTTVVHRSLCFPPAREVEQKPLIRPAA
jgi:hypothetical protein